MALFDKWKKKDKPEPIKEEAPEKAEDGLAEEPLFEPEPEPEAGTEAYLLYELRQNRTVFSGDEAAAAPAVPYIMKEIQNRMERIRRYEEWVAKGKPSGDGWDAVSSEPAKAEVFSDKDGMTGFLYCLAPVGTGAEVTENTLLKTVLNSGIRYGIDSPALARIAQERSYYRIFVIARGTKPQKGEDGKIIDHFSREHTLHFHADEYGRIDYKDTGMYQSVKKGEVICDLVPPRKGKDGSDILGRKFPAQKGNMPSVPRGKNTSVSPDGKALISDEDGDIAFLDGVFRVEPKLIISGNVDNSTGNIHFAGDVIINGEIRYGFEVIAGGNLAVFGMVEGATLSSGGDVILKQGMNGSRGGSLTAKGTVYSHFLEQIKVVAEGDVIADVIVNCDIRAGGSILATSGKGILVGGTVRASECVEAKRIGNRSETRTVIKLGVPIKLRDSAHEIEKELKEAQKTLDKINKNFYYLNSLPEIPEKHKDLYIALGEQKGFYEATVQDLKAEIEELRKRKIDYSKCHARGDIVFGVTEVILNDNRLVIREEMSKCNVYYSKNRGRLMQGTF